MIELSDAEEYDDAVANTDGIGRLRNASPSILSQGRVEIDMPT